MNTIGRDTTIVLVLALVFALVVLLIVNLLRRRKSGLNHEKYRNAWKSIEGSLDKNNMVTYQMAVLSADKLVDQAMRDLNVSGDTMGERLKSANNRFDNINDVWSAHKLRNRIAHESDVNINLYTAQKALRIFEKALKDLGAI